METEQQILWATAVIGFAAGFAARQARFCTFGALEDYVLAGNTTRLRSWVFAIAVAMIGVQLLWWTDTAAIGETFYLAERFNPFGLFIGGLMFGIGMAMVGNCAFGMLIRLGGGDLRALFVFMVMGLAAYASAHGIAAVLRVNSLEQLAFSLDGIGGQGLGHVVAAMTGVAVETASLFVGLGLAMVMLFWCFRDRDFARSYKDHLAGFTFGIAVIAAFWVTGGLAREGFAPLDVRSLTYVLPPGETIVYGLTFSGSAMTFPVALVLGTLSGVWAASILARDTHLEGYDEPREMKRDFFGAILMGFGGVTALGCTIGQGVSGMATLSLGAPIAMAGIVIGGLVGLHSMISGSVREGVATLISR